MVDTSFICLNRLSVVLSKDCHYVAAMMIPTSQVLCDPVHLLNTIPNCFRKLSKAEFMPEMSCLNY